MAIDFDAPAAKVLSPAKLAHIVLRTGQFTAMTNFYKKFLGASATYENAFLAFLAYDDEHHRIAIAGIPGTPPKVPLASGLEHIAFAFSTLEDLLLAYRQRKAAGIEPIWAVNHGPTTSIYYQDPDGNQIETQVDNFDTVEAADAFMRGPCFAENPVGTDFDPEEYIALINSGTEAKTLLPRKESGPRGFDGIPPPPPLPARVEG